MATNQPTATWRNPYWGTLSGDLAKLRPIFESLSNFLARPNFYNGVALGDGTPGDADSETGVVTPPPTTSFTRDTVTTITDALAGLDVDLDDVYADLATMQADITALETDPIDGTRITDDSIATPKLQANSVTATKLAAMSIGVGKWIASTSYTAGSSGWIIAADGTAEFNNVTVRGTVVAGAGYVTIDSNGVQIVNTTNNYSQVRWVNGSGSTIASIGLGNAISGAMNVTAPSFTISGSLTASSILSNGGITCSGINVFGTASVDALSVNGGAMTVSSTGAIAAGSLTAAVVDCTVGMKLVGYNVNLGAANSGGVGLRALVVPN